ncbi:MAG: hypothetical protein MR390_03220, partial [Oscillospiraceae bacterium]|nr:hypothetical protein [Oscillospiraceae bacterium]
AQTKQPETDTKRPSLDTLTKRLEISLRAIARGFESRPLRHKPSHIKAFAHMTGLFFSLKVTSAVMLTAEAVFLFFCAGLF